MFNVFVSSVLIYDVFFVILYNCVNLYDCAIAISQNFVYLVVSCVPNAMHARAYICSVYVC